MSEFGKGERAPWGDFPKVIRNGDLGMLKNQPEYQVAKAGDMHAALAMVNRLITDDTIRRIQDLIGNDRPVVLPILALEANGHNKIPLAMADVISDRLGLEVEMGISQLDKVTRTDSGADHRLAFNPRFEGEVKPGRHYLIVDDTLTMGGTIASLRGYIENRGGKAVAAMVMTAHEAAVDLAVKPSMLAGIAVKHGPAMNEYWKEAFGYGIDQLTQGEAGHLRAAPSVDAIRARITEARHDGISRLGSERTQEVAPSETRRESLSGIARHTARESSPAPKSELKQILAQYQIVRDPNVPHWRSSGKVLGSDDSYVYQDIGGREVCRHPRDLMERIPAQGENVTIQYGRDGRAMVQSRDLGRGLEL